MRNVSDHENNQLLKTHWCVFEGITNMTYCYFAVIKADGFGREVIEVILHVHPLKVMQPLFHG